MMNGAHSATGVLCGVAIAVAVDAPPAALALSILVGAGAALLPDIDHDQATITRSSGPITRGVAELLQALARQVYRWTRLAHDPPATGKAGEHRGLIHSPLFALLTGGVIAAGALASHWAGIAVAYLLTSAAIRSLRWSLPRSVRTKLLLGWTFTPPLLAAASTYGLVAAGAVDQVGPWLGGIVAAGMVVHSLGDGMTNSGIPFWWPVRRRCDRCRHDGGTCPGARWDRQNVLPSVLRWSAGARRETLIRVGCLGLSGWLSWPLLASALPA